MLGAGAVTGRDLHVAVRGRVRLNKGEGFSHATYIYLFIIRVRVV